MRVLIAALVVVGSTQAAVSQDIYVNDLEGCAMMASSPDGDLDFAAEGGLLLGETGYGSLEYHCSFEPVLKFDWSKPKVTTHVGYCEEPGPYITPKLFSVLLDPYSPGEVTIFTGEEEPQRFYACKF
ncbi:hypothetical protein [Phaeobacter sp. 11ANDIMAR09]|uniref:hypothetical protein n=1 Tax=Phaeobacter sp. 11ANDIMAR09 TaxID=1225647 RepID=UPI0006C88968|nr:hypothetical protein [Phaeobacter sp. 11ANDIMAR09]KPD10978.1 hypothetical protein AN476_18295 [Phaeobacter sp. 11ANDIMAR09]